MTDKRDIKGIIEELERSVDQAKKDAATRTTRLRVNKKTHRIRFENETEDSVEVVIEPKQREGI
jgi:hypothetical protein